MRHTSKKGRTRLLSVKVPSTVSAKVVRLAKQRHTTLSAIVRAAIEAYEVGEVSGSFADAAQKYIGVFDGPGDLSTNPRHFEGFGAWRR